MSQGGTVHADIGALHCFEGKGLPYMTPSPCEVEPTLMRAGHQQQNGTTTAWTNEGTPGQERLSCSICRRTFRRPENLKRHAASHMKERRFLCSHPGCDKKFYRTYVG
jgi:hypothetical protein